jgi:filamentous hemagglutinin family protein
VSGLRACLLAGAALALLAGPAYADGLPSGGTVALGKASIAKPAWNRMQIRQRSKSAIVNWNGFSIGRGDRVDIVQPSRKSAILNRVTGGTRSSIRGQLSANGQVYLVNPNGIEISRSGKVRAEGFVASTLDIRDRDFRKGRRVFASGEGAPAAVSNAGVIEARSYAALLGGKVDNAGVISAELGSIGIGAARRATLKLSGDFLQVALPPEGNPGAPLITSAGVLRADGGRVEIRAATAREAARQAINLSGVVEARSVGMRGGVIVIAAGAGGEATVSGTLDASAGKAARAIGGSVEVTGDAIRLNGASIDASGPAGGGEVHIGGDLRGQGPRPRARATEIDAASVIAADATARGAGGTVVVWSDHHTRFAGRVSARGGPEGGAGGFAEVSGKRLLAFTGTADLRGAPFGTLLLDPYNITISDDPTARTNLALDGGWFVSGDGDNSILNATQLEGLLAFNNVNVISSAGAGTQEGNITVEAALEWTSTGILTLNANAPGATILIDNTITAPQGTLQLTSLGDITTTGAAGINVGTLNGTATGDIQIGGQITAQAGSITAGGNLSTVGPGLNLEGSFDLAATAGDILLDAPLGGADVTITAGGDIDMTAAGAIVVDTLSLDAGGLIAASGSVEVGLFLLEGGDWVQNADTLPAFAATDFQIGTEATFLRVLGGGGGDEFVLADIYGVQGVGGFLGSNFVLANNIDASGTQGWNADGDDILGFRPIGFQGEEGPIGFTGELDGAGFTIDALFIDSPLDQFVGMFATLDAAADVHDLRLTNVDVTGGGSTGALAGVIGDGVTVTNVGVDGVVASDGAEIGGLAGSNAGTITNAISETAVTWGEEFGLTQVGGLVGENSGTITDSFSKGPVVANGDPDNEETDLRVGGLVGENSGTIEQSYALGSVTATGGGNLFVGGLVGGNGNLVTESFSAGAVSATGPNDAVIGGLIGGDFEGGATDSYWDVEASGQTASGGGEPLTTAEMQDGPGFAAETDWDFLTTWAPASPGFYAGLYAVDPIVRIDPNDATRQYGLANPAFTIADAFGGPEVYVFGPADDTAPDFAGTLSSPADETSDIGEYDIVAAGTVISPLGIPYRTTTLAAATLTVTPAPLTITAGSDSKVYGETYDFAGLGFTVTGLLNDDSVDTVRFASLGAPATVNVDDYDITASGPVGDGLGNYVIGFDPGTLTVTPAPLTITADSDSKVYGETYDFAGLGFTVTGLLNDDSVDTVRFASLGAPATVDVDDYDITASGPVGDGLGNYVIGFDPGTLTVTPAPLTITADDQSKRFGDNFAFDGDEFVVAGLRNEDRVDLATLTSEGAPAWAAVGDYDIGIGAARGIGLDNYNVAYVPGTLDVVPRAVRQGTNIVSLIPEIAFTLPNPPDLIEIALAAPSGTAGGRPPEPLGAVAGAADMLDYLASASARLEAEVEACRQTVTDAQAYLACLGVALDTYATAVDARILDLPAPLRGVAATIRQASQALRDVRATAARRLATAGSAAERAAIEREAMETARTAVAAAAREVREAITLLRADEPQLASLGAAQGEEVAEALDIVADGLIRAVGL